MQRGTIWSPYYKITVKTAGPRDGGRGQQHLAPVDGAGGLQGVLLPVAVHGVRRHLQGRADPRRRLGHRRGRRAQARRRAASTPSRSTRPSSASAGSGTRTGRTPIRACTRSPTTPGTSCGRRTKKYDLVVFALIDSLTLQSAFSGVRLESYMFTEESFRAVRNVLKPDGVLVVYNYFREPWLVDRLANTAAAAFGEEPMVLRPPGQGPARRDRRRAAAEDAGELPGAAVGGDRVQPGRAARPARAARARPAVVPATDNWPFLYMREPHLPSHYTNALAVVLLVSILVGVRRRPAAPCGSGRGSSSSSAPASCCSRRSRSSSSRCCGDRRGWWRR